MVVAAAAAAVAAVVDGSSQDMSPKHHFYVSHFVQSRPAPSYVPARPQPKPPCARLVYCHDVEYKVDSSDSGYLSNAWNAWEFACEMRCDVKVC